MSRKRADLMVVEQGLAEDVREARALLLSGRVLAGTERIDKAGMLLDPSTQLHLKDDRRFVSRGGEKLHGALLDFGLARGGSSPRESTERLQGRAREGMSGASADESPESPRAGRKQGTAGPSAGDGSGRPLERGPAGTSGPPAGDGSGYLQERGPEGTSGRPAGVGSGRLRERGEEGTSSPPEGEVSGRLHVRAKEGASGLSEGGGAGRVSTVNGAVCLDLGASTGGFTDCLLQHGASKVYAVDVGKGQLDWKLRQDPRVEVRDEVNVRYLEPSVIPEPVDWVVADLSFISLRLVLPVLKAFAPVRLLVLVKPQFEAERQEVEAGGRISDESLRLEILQRLEDFCRQQGFSVESRADARISGRKSGNQETFFLLRID
ncbi:MAG TPA: SAM-dependent methyltransferase [Acidobacteriota bacterium]|nr:SAM-dependent methyltransferase [Acidobacteriota bacterium]